VIVLRRDPGMRYLMWFAGTKVAFSAYLFFTFKTINAPDLSLALFFERLENFFIPVTGVFFLMFTQSFRPVFSRVTLRLLVGLMSLSAFCVLVLPNAYHEGLYAPKTFPALGITIHETRQPLWVMASHLFLLSLMIRVMIRYLIQDRAHRSASRTLVLAIVLFGVLFLHDVLVALQVIHMPYLAHFGFIVIMFAVESQFDLAVRDKKSSASSEAATAATLPAAAAAGNHGGLDEGRDENEAAWIRINCLGSLEIGKRGGAVSYVGKIAGKPKLLRLLKLLLVAFGKGIHREEAIESLWPGESEARAANNLHALLFRLRKIFGKNEVLITADNRISLNSAMIETDFRLFESAAERFLNAVRGEKYADAQHAAQVAEKLYRGHFFEFDPYFPGAETVRAYLLQLHRRTLIGLCEVLLQAGDPAGLIQASQRAIELDNVDEDAWRWHFRGLQLAGRKNEALKRYDDLKRILRSELDADPDPLTDRLISEIRTGQAGPRGVRQA
jgi:DNA-binding SARP family transcriptional activator